MRDYPLSKRGSVPPSARWSSLARCPRVAQAVISAPGTHLAARGNQTVPLPDPGLGLPTWPGPGSPGKHDAGQAQTILNLPGNLGSSPPRRASIRPVLGARPPRRTVAGMTARPIPTQPIPERVVVVGCAGSGKTRLAREVAVRLNARHIERDALGDDEAPGFAALVAAAVEAAGRRWVFDGAPYNAEALVYPRADALVALDYPRRVVWRRVVARSLRLWLTRRGNGAHTSTSPPWRWWAHAHPVRWAAQTHAARHAEIDALLARPEVAHIQRFRFTSPRQAATWLASLHR